LPLVEGATEIQPPTRFGQFEGAPTVACTIATYNADCDAYSAQIRLQEGRSEFIFDLASMIHAHLTIFAKHNNGTYPDRILIFRDGISEGQYAPVLAYENDAVIRACAKIQDGYRPKILICVCAKRHSTRFFGDQYDIDVSGNLHAGLVVDQGVTHPYAFDFFMQSHQGRVGTARPTHYVCLLDEVGVSPDELQRMVHSLCYTFARCTKSVSLVPVCYIAGKLILLFLIGE
jgi:eukaryotic translation initiation factor 2C